MLTSLIPIRVWEISGSLHQVTEGISKAALLASRVPPPFQEAPPRLGLTSHCEGDFRAQLEACESSFTLFLALISLA